MADEIGGLEECFAILCCAWCCNDATPAVTYAMTDPQPSAEERKKAAAAAAAAAKDKPPAVSESADGTTLPLVGLKIDR